MHVCDSCIWKPSVLRFPGTFDVVSDFEQIHVSGFGNRRAEVITTGTQEDSNNNSMAEEEKEEEMG